MHSHVGFKHCTSVLQILSGKYVINFFILRTSVSSIFSLIYWLIDFYSFPIFILNISYRIGLLPQKVTTLTIAVASATSPWTPTWTPQIMRLSKLWFTWWNQAKFQNRVAHQTNFHLYLSSTIATKTTFSLKSFKTWQLKIVVATEEHWRILLYILLFVLNLRCNTYKEDVEFWNYIHAFEFN